MQHELEADGHTIVAANGERACIDAFTAAHGRDIEFSLVIIDLGMPRVDGHHVADGIKKLSPRASVIMLTGSGQRMLADNDVSPNVDLVLSEPSRLRELRPAIMELTE
jgi:CheY-like chemotaxis protein